MAAHESFVTFLNPTLGADTLYQIRLSAVGPTTGLVEETGLESACLVGAQSLSQSMRRAASGVSGKRWASGGKHDIEPQAVKMDQPLCISRTLGGFDPATSGSSPTFEAKVLNLVRIWTLRACSVVGRCALHLRTVLVLEKGYFTRCAASRVTARVLRRYRCSGVGSSRKRRRGSLKRAARCCTPLGPYGAVYASQMIPPYIG